MCTNDINTIRTVRPQRAAHRIGIYLVGTPPTHRNHQHDPRGTPNTNNTAEQQRYFGQSRVGPLRPTLRVHSRFEPSPPCHPIGQWHDPLRRWNRAISSPTPRPLHHPAKETENINAIHHQPAFTVAPSCTSSNPIPTLASAAARQLSILLTLPRIMP